MALVHRLTLVVVEARGLLIMDKGGLADPYVTARVNLPSGGVLERKSNVVKQTLEPEWHETFDFEWRDTPNNNGAPRLRCTVLDKDRWMSETMGAVEIALLPLATAALQRIGPSTTGMIAAEGDLWLPLQQLEGMRRGSTIDGALLAVRGELRLRYSYTCPEGAAATPLEVGTGDGPARQELDEATQAAQLSAAMILSKSTTKKTFFKRKGGDSFEHARESVSLHLEIVEVSP